MTDAGEYDTVEVYVHERADPVEVLVLPKTPGAVVPPVHYPCNQVGRWACGGGAGGAHVSLRTEAVTCRACRRSRALRAAADLERVEAEIVARVEARHAAAAAVRVYLWFCPWCDGSGDDGGGGGRCYQCAGLGVVDGAGAAGWPDPRPVPRPPGVRRTPCHDCAYRPGSQEDEGGDRLAGPERPFFCHQGMPVVRGEYTPVAWARGLPLGSLVCAGWWDVALCGRRPDLAPAVYVDEDGSGATRQRGD